MIRPFDDAAWMSLAVDAGRRGAPAPNPHVGSVVVARGRLVGLGWHARAGEAHAEVAALRAAGTRARGAALFVTLEPCNHFGRTPPCTDAIIAAGVRRVVVACRDPNRHVIGGGVDRLRRAGVHVDVGTLEGAAGELIALWLLDLARTWI